MPWWLRSLLSIVDNYWTGVQIVKSPYGVGFAYLAQVQDLIAKATNGTKDLDDLVLELYWRFTAHEQTAEGSLSGILNGTLIVPPADCFAKFGLRLVRRDAEVFDLGFVSSGGKVSGFTSDKSRA
ncbi:hypothetical protein C8A00DRAFT_33414 [Chaetomidium leptoderma]|uniref:Uncharacterized protein n=1 Tax=Chaetomidium leptoderma TaxID=669021 RepID=A0AAN6ZYQ2_9PEZI|nr:hypothetical protein C8A00DRAFT_33414 [Chaetomidium leptoderma]